MPKFDAKTFNAEAFGKYMNAIPNARLNELFKSRALVKDSRLREVFKDQTQTGTAYATLPFFGLIGGAAQNYDGVSNLTTTNTTTFEQGVFTYGRMSGWTEADFSYDITGGVDFMANVRNQLMEYWNEIDQDVLLSVLKGIFAMSGTGYGGANKKFVDNHTLDISGETATATDATMLMSATTLNKAIQKASGDHKNRFSLALMHSEVATNLENLNLLEHLKYTDEAGVQRDLALGTWNGRIVIIDDSMPSEAKTNHSLYTTYLLGDGAFSFEEVGAKVPYEMVRDAKTRGGEDTLISRRRNAIAVSGMSYLKKTQATNSPTNAELENGGNWSLVNDGTKTIADKLVPIARIISRG